MMTRSGKWLVTAAAAAVLCVGGSALAAGGGGGGGGGTPSFSAPSFDPAEEYRLGTEALQKGDFKGADMHLSRVTEAAPKNAAVWYVLGLAKAGKGDLKAAERAYEKSVHIDPDNIAAHTQLGITLAKLNEADKAKAELDLLQKRSGVCADACPQAADLKAAVNAVQGAMGPAPSAALTPPSPLFGSGEGDAAYVQAVSLINQGRYPDALAALDRAEQAFGPHPDVLTYIGYTYRKMGQLDRAETYYRQALAIAPRHRGATEYFGELKVERGDLAGARKMLAALDAECAFDCVEAETLRKWIDKGGDPAS
jgi:Flp pilus assembly protein TadD